MTSNDRDFIRSIERGFTVLSAFGEQRPTPTPAEVAEATGLSRPAVRRILLTLQRLGYVDNDGDRWRLTPRVLSLGRHFSASHALTEAAQPLLLELADRTGESASLGVLDGTDVVYAARVPVRRIMSINVSVGTRVPAYATSMGRALLAWESPDTVDRVVSGSGFAPLGPATVTDADALREAVGAVREHGYALTSDELERGLITLAAPVRDASGVSVGALASSTSTGRASVEEFRDAVAPLITDAAERLSSRMGFTGH
ncbi:helix-turn-helix domain-containing protein [Nocardiopsis sp. HNM0947]|uniref:Helix-turn-helix domain-containing protein n=1 Tax=Nocardiopsis coralli TaxID=2772213 RepID=A0ABR9P9U1_9ACTN|nr:IclR family transcriptional regulator C-terminal domain-containing protein [Nocardiopsis coralli]MBE3000613.1 helix-turn-helix domain-containing protein [Nocardiopsis coralli]